MVQGEYVEFVLTESSNTEHEFQATEVTGIGGGPLMCETRFLNKQERTDRDGSDGNDRRRQPRRRGGGPRDSNRRRNEWVVENRRQSSQQDS